LSGRGTKTTMRIVHLPAMAVSRLLIDTPITNELGHEPEMHEGEETHDHDHHEEDATKSLRIAAVLVVLAAGLAGSLPPLYLKTFRNPASPIRLLMRAASAGVILALAAIHIIPESVEQLHTVTEGLATPYPHAGGAVVVAGVILLVVMEAVTHSLLDSHLAKSAGSDQQGHASGHMGFHTHSHSQEPKLQHSSEQQPECGPNDTKLVTLSTRCTHGHHDLTGHTHSHSGDTTKQPPVIPAAEVDAEAPCDPVTHTCVVAADGVNLPVVAAVDPCTGTMRHTVMAYMFELGCIFHSVIIGIALGVQTGDRQEVIAALVTLSFHQLLEGVALSSFVIDAGVTMIKGVTMVVVYALTCPVGIAIGIGISESYDANSVTALTVQGVFNGISGGMLLYIALVQIIAVDFGHSSLIARMPRPLMRAACYLSLIVGAAAMAVIALGETDHDDHGHAEHEEDHHRLLRMLRHV